MADKTGTNVLTGRSLVTAITSVCSAGFLLFGYDQGVMSGVVISKPWLGQMGNPSTLMIGTLTSLYDVGAVIGAVIAAVSAEPLGRKRTLILGAMVLIVGTILMGSAYERVQFMVSRILTGLGIGLITSSTPVYQSEISVAKHRGWQVCCQLTTMLFGLMLAYWINYGFYFKQGDIQWRFPLLFQLVFAVYILLLTPWLPDTPRWLMRHDGSPDRGLIVLSKLRSLPMEHPVVQSEGDDILQAIKLEAQEEGSWTDLFRSNGISAHKRFYLALGVQFMQQMSGINIVTYYAPTLFQSSLGMSSRMALLMGCFLQLFYIIASFVTWYTIDHIGRRPLLISMALGMCVVLVIEAATVATGGTGASVVAVIMVFAFEACFTWGWMGCVWVYPPEILPLKIRAKGAALAAAADFLGNFLVVEITPPALQNIGYKTYVIFAVLNLANAVIVWLFYPETGALPLEKIDEFFVAPEVEEEDENDIPAWRRVQWSVVAKAAMEVRKRKMKTRESSEISSSETTAADEEGYQKSTNERVENGK
ncbi:general substrate transporter [Viridothelium virens]|uniref:General substrate transporter n=1 Tax=Viridothelium virens TaxID=1048519 RepID=A0A6A6H9V8_VIRVR|nr:general substrate transporter [Viridothelium virens]